jgi:hypothetical protein
VQLVDVRHPLARCIGDHQRMSQIRR